MGACVRKEVVLLFVAPRFKGAGLQSRFGVLGAEGILGYGAHIDTRQSVGHGFSLSLFFCDVRIDGRFGSCAGVGCIVLLFPLLHRAACGV